MNLPISVHVVQLKSCPTLETSVSRQFDCAQQIHYCKLRLAGRQAHRSHASHPLGSPGNVKHFYFYFLVLIILFIIYIYIYIYSAYVGHLVPDTRRPLRFMEQRLELFQSCYFVDRGQVCCQLFSPKEVTWCSTWCTGSSCAWDVQAYSQQLPQGGRQASRCLCEHISGSSIQHAALTLV